MIFPSLNWYPHRWFLSLSRTDKFSCILSIFTVVLASATVLQVCAFTESERADLVVADVGFARGEPSLEANGFDPIVTIRNVGKHVADVKELNIGVLVLVRDKILPEKPEYYGGSIVKVVPPVAPNSIYTAYGHHDFIGAPQSFNITKEAVVNGILDGSIPLHVYGVVRYYTGYSVRGPSEVGYCFTYIPQAEDM